MNPRGREEKSIDFKINRLVSVTVSQLERLDKRTC